MNQYLIRIEAVFDSPRPAPEAVKRTPGSRSEWIAGFFRNFGVNAPSLSDAETIALQESNEQNAAIHIDETKQVNVKDLDPVIQKHFRSGVPGVWYRSGRIYYPPD